MDVLTAERELVQLVGELLPPGVGEELFRGALPEGANGVAVRFDSGSFPADDLAEFSAEVCGVFDEPDAAADFAGKLWGALPIYGANGFTEIAPEGALVFAETKDGRFSVRGKVRAAFA